MEPTRILLVDDHTLVRRGVAALFEDSSLFQIVGEAEDGLTAIKLAEELVPDLILMDIHMPKCNGIEATQRIKHLIPHVRVVMLTVSEDDADLFQAIKNGAQGYVSKDVNPEELFSVLESTQRGETALSPSLMARVLSELRRQDASDTVQEALTGRELEVLEEVVTGRNNKEIAATLCISEHTVKIHIRNILEKLHLQNRIQAAVHAVRHGLIELE
jgi:DNA-binding NarL/FixJ family response regulator